MLLQRSSPRRNRFAPPSLLAQAYVGVEQRIATHPLVAIPETGAVIDPAVDRTVSSADLPLLGGVHSSGVRDDVRSPASISREVLWLNPAAPCSSPHARSAHPRGCCPGAHATSPAERGRRSRVDCARRARQRRVGSHDRLVVEAVMRFGPVEDRMRSSGGAFIAQRSYSLQGRDESG
jgi:hypothetical protein